MYITEGDCMNEVSNNLSQVIKKIIPQAMLKAMNNGLQIIENEAKINCPVNDGTLRASVTYKTEQEETVYTGYIGSNVEYAPYVHEGTGIYAKEGHGRSEVPWTYRTVDGYFYKTKGQKPKPFLQDAIDCKKDDFIKGFEGIL